MESLVFYSGVVRYMRCNGVLGGPQTRSTLYANPRPLASLPEPALGWAEGGIT